VKCVLTNATVIDCVNPRPVPGASVTVENGRIVEVLGASRSPDTRQAEVIDLGGAYLLRGCGMFTFTRITSPPPGRRSRSRRRSSATA